MVRGPARIVECDESPFYYTWLLCQSDTACTLHTKCLVSWKVVHHENSLFLVVELGNHNITVRSIRELFLLEGYQNPTQAFSSQSASVVVHTYIKFSLSCSIRCFPLCNLYTTFHSSGHRFCESQWGSYTADIWRKAWWERYLLTRTLPGPELSSQHLIRLQLRVSCVTWSFSGFLHLAYSFAFSLVRLAALERLLTSHPFSQHAIHRKRTFSLII